MNIIGKFKKAARAGKQSQPVVGFVATRISGHDGVTLEVEKWQKVLGELGHSCAFFAGDLGEEFQPGFQDPLAYFKHPKILHLQKKIYGSTRRSRETTDEIHHIKEALKDALYRFVRETRVRFLICENCLSIPMHIPLGLALTEFLAETEYPAIGHHHDLFWERERFLTNGAWDYINMAFPPHLPGMRHVVINSSGANQLALRTGISAELIPNAMPFDTKPSHRPEVREKVRKLLKIREGEVFFLQPTRIVKRKGIEHAIELIRQLGRPAVLVISHASGDEGNTYNKYLREYSKLMGVKVIFAAKRVGENKEFSNGEKVSLSDMYQACDVVTYPSTMEGFGNAFLEAVYYGKPIVINTYSIYRLDIKPKGFQTIEIDGYVDAKALKHTCEILDNPELYREITTRNYQLGVQHYSYRVLKRKLASLLTEIEGV